MMEFTNADDLEKSATKFKLAGWYVQDTSGDYLGILKESVDGWQVGFTPVDEINFPVEIDRIPR